MEARNALNAPGQCETCFYCRRGTELMCESFSCAGVTRDGGFAEYIK